MQRSRDELPGAWAEQARVDIGGQPEHVQQAVQADL